MKGTVSLLTGLLACLAVTLGARAEATAPAPDFREIYDLVRAHLAGISEGELNRAAVQGLVSSLGPKVSLVPAGASSNASGEKLLVSKSSRFEDDIAYLRVGHVEAGLDKAVRETCDKLATTNKLQGMVLDLRYTDGNDYAAAAAAADLFLKKERPLLDWGKGVVRSKEKEQRSDLTGGGVGES